MRFLILAFVLVFALACYTVTPRPGPVLEASCDKFVEPVYVVCSVNGKKVLDGATKRICHFYSPDRWTLLAPGGTIALVIGAKCTVE